MTNSKLFVDKFWTQLRLRRVFLYCLFVGVTGGTVIRVLSETPDPKYNLANLQGTAVSTWLVFLFFLALRFSEKTKNFFMKEGRSHETMNTSLRQPIIVWFFLSVFSIATIAMLSEMKNRFEQIDSRSSSQSDGALRS